jgi:phage I-like protein
MAWFRDKGDGKKIDPRLEGKSAEEIAALLDEGKKAQDKAAELEAQRAEERKTVENLNNSFASVKAKLDAIEANANRQAPPDNKNKEPETLENFIDDPDTAFNQRAKPLVEMTARTAALTAKMTAQQYLDNQDSISGGTKYDGRLFKHFDTEIMNIANQTQTVVLSAPQAWLDIYLRVKGLHADELANPDTRKKSYAFLEPAAQVVNNRQQEDNSNKPADQQLTEQELRVAKRMGVSPESYLKRKKEMSFVGA